MDAEHRHELKTNELAEWIAHFPEFLKKNRNQIIFVIVIIIAVIGFLGYKNRNLKVKDQQQAEATNQMQMIEKSKVDVLKSAMAGNVIESAGFADSASALEVAAEKTKHPLHAALALIKRGEALRAELHYAGDDPDKDLIASNIKLAKEAYDQALIEAKGNATLTAMATYGLGLCDEEIGDFTKAAEIFKGIATNEAFKGTIFPAQAQLRLDVMEDHKKQFTFVAAPIVAPIPGFDKATMEAKERGDIYFAPPAKPKLAPVIPPAVEPEDTTPPTVTPEATPEAKPEPKPDTDDASDKSNVYEVGPQPPKTPDTE